MTANKDLRKMIIEMVWRGRDGHIPSSFSIVDIVELLYRSYLKFDPKNPQWSERDYFILSKGHGCPALYAVLQKYGFLSERDLEGFCRNGGILGEHPDATQVPGLEASTGSLGHGLAFAAGIALGLRLREKTNRVYVLVGDGECHEGTIWEAANLARNLELGNLCVLVDWNGSAAQLLKFENLEDKWRAFGWRVSTADGHSEQDLRRVLDAVPFALRGAPAVVLARTVKGKGVPMLEGHGVWHHRIPTGEEYQEILKELS